MDIESHLQRVEADLRRTRVYVWALLVIVTVIGLGLLHILSPLGCLIVLALLAVAHLLVSALSGLRRFWPSREADAQLQERILRGFIAERAKTRSQTPNRP